MTATFKWGLLSTARINRAILTGMALSERGEVLGVASRDGAKARAYADEKGLERAYGSYEEMLADPDIQIVYNSLPNSLHADWTLKALRAGKHVLCEKPFAQTLTDVDEMFATAHANNRVVAEAFMYRHHPKVIKLKALVDSGAIGPVRLVRASFSFYLENTADVRLNAELGGGSLWDVGCYPVSLVRYLLGAPERVSAWQRAAANGVDKTLVATLYYGDERIAQIDSSFEMPYRGFAEVVGERGVLTFNQPFHADQPASMLTLRQGDESEVIEVANPERYWLEIEDMHDAILTGAPTLITPADTRGHIETILQLYEAARGG
jgi:D-xylose 1-dehydrogenase (NADP+, D-xylono-1,5-lactone-forming)